MISYLLLGKYRGGMIMANFRSQIADEVKQRLQKKERFQILDVREIDEWVFGHIPGAKHIPLLDLPSRLHELDPNTEYVVVCHSGYRSAHACQFLAQQGFDVVNMIGGMSVWNGDIAFGNDN